MHNQLSIQVDRKLQNSLILSMKSSIEERIRQSSNVLLQLLYTHFHQDHEDQQLQQRRSSVTSFEVLTPTLTTTKKSKDESNNNINTNTNTTNNNNNASVKVSALVAHYSSGDVTTPSSTAVNVSFNVLEIKINECLGQNDSIMRGPIKIKELI